MILIANNKRRNNILNFKNSSIFIVGAAGKYIINFVILVIFARILSPSDYGYWIQLLAIFSIAQFFIECGQINILMSQARSFDDVFRNLLVWNAYLIIATYLVVLPFTIFFLGLENYSINIYIFLFSSIPMNLLANLLFAKAQSVGRFALVNTIPFIILTCGFLAALLYIYFVEVSIDALALKLLIESLVNISTAFYFTGPYLLKNLPKTFKINKLFTSVNAFTAIGDLAIKSSNHIDKILLSSILPSAILGFYSRAYSIGIIVVSIGGYSLTTLGLQSSAIEKPNKGRNFMSLYLVFLSIFSFHFLFYYSEYALLIILGNNWIEYVSLGWIISLMPAMKFFENYFYISCVGEKKSGLFTMIYILTYIISIAVASYFYFINQDISVVIFAFFGSGLFVYLLSLILFLKIKNFSSDLYYLVYALSSVFIYFIYNSFIKEYFAFISLPFFFTMVLDLALCSICIIPFLYILVRKKRFL